MYCKSCGAYITNTDTVCPICGDRILGHEEPVAKTNIQIPNGTLIIGRYRIDNIVGRGGFCYTYIATDTFKNTTVAIKEFFPKGIVYRPSGLNVILFDDSMLTKYNQGKERFLSEARMLSEFSDNPGIVSIYDYFEGNGTAYIVMEYLRGQNLSQYIKYIGSVPDFGFTSYIAGCTCDILYQVHLKGIIHRDLSLDNIFLCENGEIKLIDFGAAIKRNTYVENRNSGYIVVKQGYTPVEQYFEDGDIGVWTDIYALGATLYKLTTGRIPVESIERQKEDSLVPPHLINPNIPVNFSNAIMKALSIRSEDRFPDVLFMKQALFSGEVFPAQYNETDNYAVADAYQEAKINGMDSGMLAGTSVLVESDAKGSQILYYKDETGRIVYVDGNRMPVNTDNSSGLMKRKKELNILTIGIVGFAVVMTLIFIGIIILAL